ncbi:MAG: carbonic anhydrase [Chloroflexota bacterium]
MAQTQQAPPTGAAEALQPPPDVETPAAAGTEVEETPEIIRVKSSGLSGPLLYLAVGIPVLLLSFLGSWFAVRSQPGPAVVQHEDWKYEGEHGPSHWGETDPASAACQLGSEQSPIDIHPSRLLQIDWLSPIQFKYKPDKDLELVRDGHGFVVKYDPGSRMSLLGQEFELTQFHFHTPSEHTVSGRPADMELHLVHATPDSAKRLAKLGVLISEGAENPALARFWSQIPEKEAIVKTKIELNASDLLPRNQRYFTYDGSLTTPPCTQGVRWVVFREPITASRAQIERFRGIFKHNARPAQPIKDRFVREELPPAPAPR